MDGPGSSLASQLHSLEESLLDPEVRRDAAMTAGLLHDDFVEFGASGRVFNKEQVISALRDEPASARSLTDFHLLLLSPDVALVTYASRRADGGRALTSLRSSIWQRVDGRWRLRFHQGTPLGTDTDEQS